MFKTDKSAHRGLLPLSVGEMIPQSSDVWLYIDLFDQLNLEEFYWNYSTQGQEGHDPKLILRTIFYGLTHGMVSGRKLADACVFDSRYIVLSGENHPSYRAFSRFVDRHSERLESLFVEVVRLAHKMGLVSLGRIAIDGSKFKAHTSKHRAMSYGRMQPAIEQIKKELQQLREDLAKRNSGEINSVDLPKEIELREYRLKKIREAKAAIEKEARLKEEAPNKKAQKSFNDLDAKPFAKKKGEFSYTYNCQSVVDADNQIIVAAEIHDSTHDSHALPTMLEKVEETFAQHIVGQSFLKDAEVLADNGYKSFENLEKCHTMGAKAYIAVGRGESWFKSPVRDLKYYPKLDQFRCVRGKTIPTQKRLSKNGYHCLKISQEICSGCPRTGKCQLWSKGQNNIWVPSGSIWTPLKSHQTRMSFKKGKEIYRMRKAIVETPFGNIKNKGIQIRVKGSKKVSSWWKMAATAHNIEKIVKKWPKPTPE